MGDFSQYIKDLKGALHVPNVTILFASLIWVLTLFGSQKWEDENAIRDDVTYYYSYLPATFIYKDLSFEFVSSLSPDVAKNIWFDSEKKVPKMTMGLAVLYLPFFSLAHIYAVLFDNPNGYSSPYQLMLLIGALFYGVLGLLFLKKSLLKYFDPLPVSLCLLLLSLGSNLYHYVAYEGAMSHVYSFFLFSVFVYVSSRWIENPNKLNSFLVGLLSGLIVLVRPTNVLVLVFPLLLNVDNGSSIRRKVQWFLNHYTSFIIAIVIALLVLLPQFLYWKIHAGSWLYYSYGNEAFYFGSPHIFEGLFGFRKGWFLYTPIMLFSFLGFVHLKKRHSFLFWPILAYVFINIYVVFSWWCWWYGGSFGARALIESYSLLAFPLCAFLSFVLNGSSKVKKTVFLMVFGLFVLLNVFQSKQYDVSILHWDSMSKASYWGIFAKSERPSNYLDLLDPPDYEGALKGTEKAK